METTRVPPAISLSVRFNRTLEGWKLEKTILEAGIDDRFQSNLRGMETYQKAKGKRKTDQFQSNLRGMETQKKYLCI